MRNYQPNTTTNQINLNKNEDKDNSIYDQILQNKMLLYYFYNFFVQLTLMKT